MDEQSFDRLVNNTLKILKELLPTQEYLYLPLLSRALVWALNRYAHRREELMATPVWPLPQSIKVKSDEFVIDFFRSHPQLKHEFAAELEKRDMPSLRLAFDCLYPVVGLEDPFLTGLFASQLEKGEYRSIVSNFPQKLAQAKRDLEQVSVPGRLNQALEDFEEDIRELVVDLSSESEVRQSLIKLLKQALKKSQEEGSNKL